VPTVARGRKKKVAINDEEIVRAEKAPATSNKGASSKKSAKTEPEKSGDVDESKKTATARTRRQKCEELQNVPEEPEAPPTVVARGRKRKVATIDEEAKPETATSSKQVLQTKSDKVDAAAITNKPASSRKTRSQKK